MASTFNGHAIVREHEQSDGSIIYEVNDSDGKAAYFMEDGTEIKPKSHSFSNAVPYDKQKQES